MDQRRLLTQKDLAERWKVAESSISTWRKEGIIQQAKGIPVIRFSPEYVEELEGIEFNRFSPLERKRMENELEELRVENTKLKEIISKTLAIVSEAITFE